MLKSIGFLFALSVLVMGCDGGGAASSTANQDSAARLSAAATFAIPDAVYLDNFRRCVGTGSQVAPGATTKIQIDGSYAYMLQQSYTAGGTNCGVVPVRTYEVSYFTDATTTSQVAKTSIRLTQINQDNYSNPGATCAVPQRTYPVVADVIYDVYYTSPSAYLILQERTACGGGTFYMNYYTKQ